MKYALNEQTLNYIKNNKEEQLQLLIELAKIPAPSNKENKRAEFCKNWLEKNGAKNVYIDEAKNVVYPYNCEKADEIIVFMAHMDIVFDDEEELPVYIKDGLAYAPGIGDDTANLVNLLLSAKYVTQNNLKSDYGIIFVMDSCEEGLGNLKGCKKIIETYKNKIKEFIAFDGYMSHITNKAVGSQRYKVTVKTEGGHSYKDFGNKNSIYYLSSMIQKLYEVSVPKKAKTTYNVGTISGGTTVNTIAEEASMLYEFRSLDMECLKQMEENFMVIINNYRKMGINVEIEDMGIRPCSGNVNEEQLQNLSEKSISIVKYYYKGDIDISASSTDSNVPLSIGIPANTIGTVRGGAAHTRGEWVELESLQTGWKIALAMVLSYL